MTFRKKLENYWYYYKTHTIFALLSLLFIALSIVQCSKNVEHDIALAYVSSVYMPTEQIQQSLAKIVPDINGDGKVNVFFDSIIIPEKPVTDADFNMIQKLSVTFIDGGTRVFIMDKAFFDVENYAEMFKPLHGIADGERLKNGIEFNGVTIAVSTMDCPYLVENKMAAPHLYVGILNINKVDEDKKNIANIYKASEDLLKEFMK